MKTKLIFAILAVAIFGPVGARAQAYTVTTDGRAQEERTIAAADQATPEQLAKLFDLMRIKGQVQQMRQIVPQMFQQQIQAAMKQAENNVPAGTKVTDEQRQRMQEVMTRYIGKAMDLYPSDEMLTDMTTIYQRHLSKEDVDGLIAFYGSPAGQHLLDAQPLIAKEFMPMVMSKVAERSQALTREMAKDLAEIVPSNKPAAKTGTTATPQQ